MTGEQLGPPRVQTTLRVLFVSLSFLGFWVDLSAQEQGVKEEWEVTLVWEVGDLMGPVAFTRIADLAVSQAGRVFVSLPDLSEVWEFDLQGNWVHTLGRKGRGPGEFESPDAVFFRSDTLVVWDDRLFRLSFFDGDGDFIESYPAGLMSNDVGMLADGSVISVSAGVPSRDIVSGRVTEVPLRRLPPDAKGYETMSLLSVRHWMMEVQTGMGKLYGTQPFSDHDLWRVAENGGSMVLIERGVESVDSPPTFSITVFDSTGSLSKKKEIVFEPVSLNNRTVRDAAERQSKEVIGLRVQRNISFPEGAYSPERFREAYYQPEVQPPVEDIGLGADGEIWLRRETQSGSDDVPWLVLNQRLDKIGTVALPKGLTTILPFGDLLLAARKDEMEVFHLACFRIHRN